jgi:hypothetical protein
LVALIVVVVDSNNEKKTTPLTGLFNSYEIAADFLCRSTSRFLSLPVHVRPASASGYHDELAQLIRVSLDFYLPELKFHGPASDVLTVAGTTTSGQYYVHSDVLYLQNTTLYVFLFRLFAWLINSDITTMHKTSIKMLGRCSTTEETRTTLQQIISSCAFMGTMDIWSNGWKWKYT